MLVLALLLAVSDQDLPAKLRHLESAAEAWAPAPSLDGTRVAFLTTLFGTRQAASVAVDGSYPTQLTDEPGGVVEIRYVPFEPGQLVAVGLLAGRPEHHRTGPQIGIRGRRPRRSHLRTRQRARLLGQARAVPSSPLLAGRTHPLLPDRCRPLDHGRRRRRRAGPLAQDRPRAA